MYVIADIPFSLHPSCQNTATTTCPSNGHRRSLSVGCHRPGPVAALPSCTSLTSKATTAGVSLAQQLAVIHTPAAAVHNNNSKERRAGRDRIAGR